MSNGHIATDVDAETRSPVEDTPQPRKPTGKAGRGRKKRRGLVGETRRITSLADSLTSLSSLMSRRRRYESVAVADLARSVWTDVSADEATLRLETGDEVVADREWLTLAIRALIANAVRHGGPEVTVRVGVEGGALYVADDGPGIPIARRDDVVRSGYSTDETGAGFGFTVVEHVTKAHDWGYRIADSREGGTRVELLLDR